MLPEKQSKKNWIKIKIKQVLLYIQNMKAVILAGGYGTRISEETHLKPKPLIEIGEMPILWHIMKIYSAYDIMTL